MIDSRVNPLESWRAIWRSAVVGCLSRQALAHLYVALETNDPRLIRGANTYPPVLRLFPGDDPGPCQCACPLAFGLWQAAGYTQAVEVEEAFVHLLEAVALKAGSKLAIVPLLDWIDFAEWGQVRLELLGEIAAVIAPPSVPLAVSPN